MPTQQGSLDLLNDPIAKELLNAPLPMRLAYTWIDGTPRLSPLWFQWTGSQLVAAGPVDAPKLKALKQQPKVALTIDSDTMPYHVLSIRGTAHITLVDGVAPEYAAASKRYMGEEGGAAWIQQIASISSQMARIAITPEWAGIMDFEKRFPNSLERAMEQAMGGS